jgi:hypothetical protein
VPERRREMDFKTFGLNCVDRESAENIKSLLEEVGYVVEPFAEWVKRKGHKTPKKIKTVHLIVDLPSNIDNETVEMIVARSEIQKNGCVTLVL